MGYIGTARSFLTLPDIVGSTEWVAQVQAALGELQSSYGLYRSVEYRAVLRHDPATDLWLNVLGKIQYSDKEQDQSNDRLDFLVEPHVYGVSVSLTSEGALQLLRDFSRGGATIKVGSRDLAIILTDKPDVAPSRYAPENISTGRYDTRYGTEYSVATFPFGIPELLHRVAVPQENLAPLGMHAFPQLLHHFVIEPGGPIPTNTYTRPETGLVVVLPFFHARFGEISIDKNALTTHVDLPKGVPPEDFSLVIKADHYGGRDGWGDGRERPIIYRPLPSAMVRHDFPTTVRAAYVELFWDKAKTTVLRKVDSNHAKRVERSVNPQLQFYGHLDADFAVLTDKLSGDDQIGFEWAIAHLFSLAGFHIAWPGYLRGPFKQREIDVLAWVPERKWLVLAECTVKGADVDRKLIDLADKAAIFSKEFEDWTIKRVLFTTIGGEALRGRQDKTAHHKGIIVVASESIQRFADLVRAGHPHEGIWHGLRSDVSYPSFLDR